LNHGTIFSMKMSQSLIATLRETPRDAEIISHQLMLRAGLIKKVASGIYSLLPLGLQCVRKFEAIVRQEMNNVSGQEVLLPMVCPSDLWEKSGRWQKYGKELLRFSDRHDNDFCLGPTHEEVITDLVKQSVTSYKKLPLLLYQIQTKFRDEIRPRFGLMRGREFVMKDAYSFHDSVDSLDKMYTDLSHAYQRIFERCGLSYREVEADNGSIGGSASAEFMVTADTGEDVIIDCDSCSFAANIEAAECLSPDSDDTLSTIPEAETFLTPGVKTIEDLAASLGVEEHRCLKSLVYKADDEFVLVLVRGDHQLNEIKLSKALNVSCLDLASEQDVKLITGAEVGSVGPVNLKERVKIIADLSVKTMQDLIVGANQSGKHIKHVVRDRDFFVDSFYDLRFVTEGDPCPRCSSGTLSFTRGIEVGHIFKLGTSYSESLEAKVLDQNGKQIPIVMGCYGIGIGRTIAATIEQYHDEHGIKWPIQLAPYHVSIILTSKKEDELTVVANDLYMDLQSKGIEVILDDRHESPGVKFKDSQLIGFPFVVVVGKHYKERQCFELQFRSNGEKKIVSKEALLEVLTEALK